MRRFLSFLMASAIPVAGLALGVFEIVRADGVRLFVLFGALVMVWRSVVVGRVRAAALNAVSRGKALRKKETAPGGFTSLRPLRL